MSKSFRKDLTGQRFGKLVVLEFVPTADQASYWKCECDCGNTRNIRGSRLITGKTVSCGCLGKKHGLNNTRLYQVWADMKSRCYNSNHHWYSRYGGRGIIICDEWRDDFQQFYDWAMSNGYKKGLSIDRIDNNGNYESFNCRWVSILEQSHNRSTNVMVEYCGELICMSEAARLSGISRGTLNKRYRKGERGEELFRPVKR